MSADKPLNRRIPGEDDDVHLAGVILLDFLTLCGYCWPDSGPGPDGTMVMHYDTDERVTCKGCLAAVEHTRDLIKHWRSLGPKAVKS